MTRYELNQTNIDIASKEITDFLAKEKVASGDIQRIRLSEEEILLEYLDRFDDGKRFAIITSKRFRTLKVEIVVVGDSIDPFSDDNDGGSILNTLLANVGLAPTWRLIKS